MSKISRQLGQLLVDNRLLTRDLLEHELKRSEELSVPLARLLVEEGQVREEDILRVVADRLDIEFIEFGAAGDGEWIDPAALQRIDGPIARQLLALPLKSDEDGQLRVAVADPFNQEKIGALQRVVGAEVTLALAPRKALQRAIDAAYQTLVEGADGDERGSSREAVARVETLMAEIASKSSELPHINALLEILLERAGSDLHLAAGSPPVIRINGELEMLSGYPKLTPVDVKTMIYEILTSRQREELEENRELDCSHPLPGRGRFRVNVFYQRDSIGAVMRAIPNEILSLEDLGMPSIVSGFAALTRGLVLVTGPTGSGKTTTLASLIDLINQNRYCHVMTVEDPIEFVHRHNSALVNQREVGADTLSFADALRHVLRQDPDVILVGEMRDLETIGTAITASETGHLVFATLHTHDAAQSIERMIDVFPPEQQQQVRVQLAGSLQAVVSQQLVPSSDGSGRIAAVEVMVATPAIRHLIREGKVHQISSAMQAGARHGMQTMDQALASLVRRGTLDHVVALERCQNPEDFEALLGKGGR